MEIRFYEDPDRGLPHIYGHGVTEEEVRQVLCSRGEDLPGRRDSRMKLGQTAAGRYLQVIYVPDEDPESVFVITAYELQGPNRLPPPTTEKAAMSQQRFPPGWDEERVREVLLHYDDQTEVEQFAEIEAAREAADITMIAVPTDLAPEVRALIARRQSA